MWTYSGTCLITSNVMFTSLNRTFQAWSKSCLLYSGYFIIDEVYISVYMSRYTACLACCILANYSPYISSLWPIFTLSLFNPLMVDFILCGRYGGFIWTTLVVYLDGVVSLNLVLPLILSSNSILRKQYISTLGLSILRFLPQKLW